jgi:RNA polymerase subunit RPABC4/transcription elongation factor Spt4
MARYTCTECGASYEADAGVCPDCGSEEFQFDPEAPRKIEEPEEIAARGAWCLVSGRYDRGDCGWPKCECPDVAPRKIEPPGEIAARAWPEDDGWEEHSAEDVADYLDWRRDCDRDEQMVRS